MYIGGYTLDLYCENDKFGDGIHAYNEFPRQFVTHDRAEAFREARKEGWKITKDGKCYCPKCNKKD